jgi:hypothetical protein
MTAATALAVLAAAPSWAVPPPVPTPTAPPVDTGDGVAGVPRGSVPALGTPDLTGLPGLERLPRLELAPLPTDRTAPQG